MSSFSLTSSVTFQAAIRQYLLNDKAPVPLTLLGPQSYCYLKEIQDPKLKETLVKVGTEFEKKAVECPFYNVYHAFMPTEKKNGDDRADFEDYSTQVQDIFAFVKKAADQQTEGRLALGLTDVSRLAVNKAEDRCTFMEPIRAYRLEITLSENTVKMAEKSGLVFQKYYQCKEARFLGVGQTI